MVRLEQVLDSWKSIREDTAAAVLEFPANEFEFRAAPQMDSFGQIARHILQAGQGLSGLLLAGEEDFTAPGVRDRMAKQMAALPPESSPEELAKALRESLERRAAELAAQTPEFYARIITRFDGQKVTRLEMVQSLKEHELTHRAQLFVYLRLKGLVPSTTRRRLAKQAAK